MSSTGKSAWMVATSIGVVEALKDQGLCRSNYALRSVQQHAKANIRHYSQAKKLSTPSSSALSKKLRDEKLKQPEELITQRSYVFKLLGS